MNSSPDTNTKIDDAIAMIELIIEMQQLYLQVHERIQEQYRGSSTCRLYLTRAASNIKSLIDALCMQNFDSIIGLAGRSFGVVVTKHGDVRIDRISDSEFNLYLCKSETIRFSFNIDQFSVVQSS